MKNKVKVLGNIVVVIAISLIIKKLMEFNINYSDFISCKNIIIVIVMCILYGINVFFCSFPWFNIIRNITDEKITFSESATIFTKANLLKYIPGNVLQYVGRNELAFRYSIGHIKVAFSTFCDVFTNICAIAILVFLFSKSDVIRLLGIYNLNINAILIISILCLIVLFTICFYYFRTRKKALWSFVTKKFFLAFAINIIFYIVVNAFSSILYIFILKDVINIHISSYGIIIGCFLLSWIVGFLVPGAPGGIGVREATITLLLAKTIPSEFVIVSILIYRIITTVGDLLGFVIAAVYYAMLNKYIFGGNHNEPIIKTRK